MPELRDVARVTRRGEDLPDLRDEGELQTNAWLLYEAARTEVAKAGSGAQPYEHSGIPGMRWVASINALMMDLWRPQLTNDSDDSKSQTFKRQLHAYLAATQNLVCVARSASKSTWWVRDEWNPNPPQPRAAVSQRDARVPAVAPAVDVPAEATPADQGDLKVSYKCLWPEGCEHVFPTEASRAAHHFASHRSARSYVAEALAGSQPVTDEVLHKRMQDIGYPGSVETTQRTLVSMRQAGLVRSHGIAGEEDETWSLPGVPARVPAVKFAPPRDKRADDSAAKEPAPASAAPEAQAGYRCREPGCTEPPFADMWTRKRHELAAHPDKSSRKYPCTYPGCNERFYDATPVSIHAARLHGIRRDTPEGQALLNAAIAAAEGKATPVPQVTPVPQAAPAPEAKEPSAPAAPAEPEPAAPTPLREGVDALDAVAALVEEVRQRRAESAKADTLRLENTALREENAGLRDRVSRMRRIMEEG